MKRIVLSLFIALLACPTLLADDGTSMNPIISKARSMTELLEDDYDKEIVRIELDILQETKVSFRTLSKGYTYNIVAFGDYRFEDIDVRVYRKSGGEWVLEDKDTDSSDTAIVSVTPNYTQEYRIEITAYKFKSGYTVGHYGLIVCHEK